MISLSKAAVGQKIRVNFYEDISSASSFTMTIEPQVGDKIDLVPTLGTSAVTVGDETYSANQYIEYTTTADLFPYVGRWRKKATATISASDIKAQKYSDFRVTE